MKTSLLLLLTTCLAFSCVTEENFNPDQFPQTWVLAKMAGQMANSETTGKDMEWLESYMLNSNGTFTKQRVRGSSTIVESGKYAYVDWSDGKYLELTFERENSIVGSCTSQKSEILRLESTTKLISTWHACDGPSLEYVRVQ